MRKSSGTHHISQIRSLLSVWKMQIWIKHRQHVPTTRFNFGSTVLFNLHNNKPQALDSEVSLYVDDTCLLSQHRNI